MRPVLDSFAFPFCGTFKARPALSRAGKTMFFAWLALAAGCATKQNLYFQEPAGLSTGESTVETVAIHEIHAPVLGHDPVDAHPSGDSFRFPSGASVTNRWAATWVALDRWAADFAIGLPQRTVSGDTTRYTVPTRTGACVLTIGSRLARWNGTAVWLGFAPRFIEGRPHIHALDAQATLQPLAALPAAAAAGRRVIVIDPGHGGADAGTRGPRGEREKDFTLDWALRVERLLTNAGWNVILTRRTDMDLPLAQRVAIADRANAALFISLHFNSAHPQTGPSGIETFCLTPHGAPSTLSRGYADDVNAVFANNAFERANVQLAYQLHRELISRTGAYDNGVKRARFMAVLRYQSRPAVLIEGGFLSNPADLTKVASGSYRETLAEAVVRALQ